MTYLSTCNRYDGVEGITTISSGQIESFVEGPIWQAILFEVSERDKYIIERLRMGNDQFWSDDNMRGRLNELEYVVNIPDILLQAIKIAEKMSENEKEKE